MEQVPGFAFKALTCFTQSLVNVNCEKRRWKWSSPLQVTDAVDASSYLHY